MASCSTQDCASAKSGGELLKNPSIKVEPQILVSKEPSEGDCCLEIPITESADSPCSKVTNSETGINNLSDISESTNCLLGEEKLSETTLRSTDESHSEPLTETKPRFFQDEKCATEHSKVKPRLNSRENAQRFVELNYCSVQKVLSTQKSNPTQLTNEAQTTSMDNYGADKQILCRSNKPTEHVSLQKQNRSTTYWNTKVNVVMRNRKVPAAVQARTKLTEEVEGKAVNCPQTERLETKDAGSESLKQISNLFTRFNVQCFNPNVMIQPKVVAHTHEKIITQLSGAVSFVEGRISSDEFSNHENHSIGESECAICMSKVPQSNLQMMEKPSERNHDFEWKAHHRIEYNMLPSLVSKDTSNDGSPERGEYSENIEATSHITETPSGETMSDSVTDITELSSLKNASRLCTDMPDHVPLMNEQRLNRKDDKSKNYTYASDKTIANLDESLSDLVEKLTTSDFSCNANSKKNTCAYLEPCFDRDGEFERELSDHETLPRTISCYNSSNDKLTSAMLVEEDIKTSGESRLSESSKDCEGLKMPTIKLPSNLVKPAPGSKASPFARNITEQKKSVKSPKYFSNGSEHDEGYEESEFEDLNEVVIDDSGDYKTDAEVVIIDDVISENDCSEGTYNQTNLSFEEQHISSPIRSQGNSPKVREGGDTPTCQDSKSPDTSSSVHLEQQLRNFVTKDEEENNRPSRFLNKQSSMGSSSSAAEPLEPILVQKLENPAGYMNSKEGSLLKSDLEKQGNEHYIVYRFLKDCYESVKTQINNDVPTPNLEVQNDQLGAEEMEIDVLLPTTVIERELSDSKRDGEMNSSPFGDEE